MDISRRNLLTGISAVAVGAVLPAARIAPYSAAAASRKTMTQLNLEADAILSASLRRWEWQLSQGMFEIGTRLVLDSVQNSGTLPITASTVLA